VSEITSPSRRARIEVEVPEALVGEVELFLAELTSGARPRLTALARDRAVILERAIAALDVIVTAIRAHPGTGQAGRLVAFLAGVYCGSDYPFDLTDLRALDDRLAEACLEYLNHDRLGIREVHGHLPDGGRVIEGWIEDYGLKWAAG
jgi:hypothetical protein